MPPFLLKLALLITLSLTATSLIVRALGSTQPFNPALRGFTEGCEGKPQPCWYGIVPGVTTVVIADNKLKMLRYEYEISPKYPQVGKRNYINPSLQCSKLSLISRIQSSLLVDTLEVDQCQSVFLEDFIEMFDSPNKFYLHGWSFYNSNVLVDLKYKYEEQGNRCMNFMPVGSVASFSISSHNNLIGGSIPEVIYAWHGFLPYQQYVTKYDFLNCSVLDHLP